MGYSPGFLRMDFHRGAMHHALEICHFTEHEFLDDLPLQFLDRHAAQPCDRLHVLLDFGIEARALCGFDAALPQYKVAVEQEGGLWIRGRHNRASGYIADLEKYNAAVLLGWRVLRYTPQQIKAGLAYADVERLLIAH